MKSKIQYFDLAVCLLWILSAFCGRYYWNQFTTVYLGSIVLLRLAISFALERKEKKTWMPLLVFIGMWALLSYDFRIYNGIGEIGDYFFHVTRLEYNRYVDWCIAGSIWVWIVVMPIVYYLYLLFRKRLDNTGMTKKELFGSILWHDRRAQYFCAITAISFFSLCAGYSMDQRFCQSMCFVAPPLVYWMVCRYFKLKAEKVWLLLLGSVAFWYAQSLGGVFRVAALAISFTMMAYTCTYLYKSLKSHTVTIASILYLGILLPTFSIGYNQYTCLNYPRNGYYYLAPYNGILYINDTTNGDLLGLRDRYGLLVEPEYEHIRPGFVTQWGWTTSFLLQKDGFSQTYNVYDNEIIPSDIKPELQSRLCNILIGYFDEFDEGCADRGEILVTDLQEDKTIGHVRLAMHGLPIWQYECSNFLPEDSATVQVNEFLRTDSVDITEYENKNILCYAENIPNDSTAKYKVYVRLALDKIPVEREVKNIADKVRNLEWDKW